MKEIRGDTKLPPFLPYPRFLLEMDLPDTAKTVYILLLSRARLSQNREGWCNEAGDVYVNFTISAMSQAVHKGETSVKGAYRKLEAAGLIRRECPGRNKPSRIYVRLPEQAENCLPKGRKPDASEGGKPAASNKKSDNDLVMAYGWGEYL